MLRRVFSLRVFTAAALPGLLAGGLALAALSGPAVVHVTDAAYRVSAGMTSCIIARESGGNPRAVNPYSGAGGLFQFLPSTWHSLGFGGLPEYASVATQYKAYYKEVSLSGYSAWAPYDGC